MKPEIETYTDYRKYLRDRFKFEKSTRKIFSHKYCALKLGTNKAYLMHVIERRRHITLDKFPAISQVFKLNDFEQQYFLFLFLRNTTSQKSIKIFFESILFSLRDRKNYTGAYNAKTQSPPETDILFKSWLSMAIHSLARFSEFKADPQWIRDQFPDKNITLEFVKTVLDELLSNNMIIEEDGRFRTGTFVFREGNYFDADTFKIYKVALTKANDVLDQIASYHPRHFHMMSLGLDEQTALEAIEIMKESRDKLIALSKKTTNPSKVFFVSNNFFAVTK